MLMFLVAVVWGALLCLVVHSPRVPLRGEGWCECNEHQRVVTMTSYLKSQVKEVLNILPFVKTQAFYLPSPSTAPKTQVYWGPLRGHEKEVIM